MNELCFFLVRSLDSPMEFYTIVVEGEKKSVEEDLKMFFVDVRFLKTLPLNSKDAYRYKGNRKLGDNIIRGCYYSRDFI